MRLPPHPTSDTSHIPHAPDWMAIDCRFPQTPSLLSLINLLPWLTNLLEILTCIHQCIRGEETGCESNEESRRGRSRTKELPSLWSSAPGSAVHESILTLWDCGRVQKCSYWVFIEASLQRHEWLSHRPLASSTSSQREEVGLKAPTL